MGSVKVTETIEAPVATVFAYVDDHRNTTKYMKDLTKWAPVDGKSHGKGAVFNVAMKAGPKVLESTVVIGTWTENKTIAWESTEGFYQKGRWAFTGKGNTTQANFELEFDLGGGMAGKLLARAVEPVVRMNCEKSVGALKLQAEALHAKNLKGAAAKKPAKAAPAR